MYQREEELLWHFELLQSYKNKSCQDIMSGPTHQRFGLGPVVSETIVLNVGVPVHC